MKPFSVGIHLLGLPLCVFSGKVVVKNDEECVRYSRTTIEES